MIEGGIYIFWNKSTGLFYLGSALRYFKNKGRLNDYFMKSRIEASLNKNSTKKNKKAKLIFKYGIGDFYLILIPYSTDLLNLKKIRAILDVTISYLKLEFISYFK